MKNLLKKIPTNINNTNNYNNYNDNNNTNDITTNNNTNHCWSLQDPNNGSGSKTSSSPLGEEIKENIVSQSEGFRKLPAAWKWAKWDLFQDGFNESGTPSLKMKLTFSNKRTGKQYTYSSALNTPWDQGRMAYGVDKEKWKTDYHWAVVKKHYHSIKTVYDDVRSSKLVEPYKGRPTEVAIFVYKDQGIWCIDMILNGEIYYFVLDGQTTEAQSNTGVVATIKIGTQGKKMLTLDEGGFV